jgi:hypothetical protein
MRTTLLAVVLSSTAPLAHADVDASSTSPADRRNHSRVGATVGLFTPVGEAGLEYTYVVRRDVEIGFGAGLGNLGFGEANPQAAIMPRLRTPIGAGTLTLGTGLSGGPYTNRGVRDADYVFHEQSTSALWANVEAGVQITSQRGPFARVALGVGKVIAHSTIEADDTMYMNTLADDLLPFAALTIGTAL